MRTNLAQGPVTMATMLGTMALILAGCASPGETDVVTCPDPRPQVCTLEYAPACGVDAAGEQQEFASPCNACATEGIVGYRPGPCPE